MAWKLLLTKQLRPIKWKRLLHKVKSMKQWMKHLSEFFNIVRDGNFSIGVPAEGSIDIARHAARSAVAIITRSTFCGCEQSDPDPIKLDCRTLQKMQDVSQWRFQQNC